MGNGISHSPRSKRQHPTRGEQRLLKIGGLNGSHQHCVRKVSRHNLSSRTRAPRWDVRPKPQEQEQQPQIDEERQERLLKLLEALQGLFFGSDDEGEAMEKETWHDRNPEESRARRQARYWENLEGEQAVAAKYYEENRDEILEKKRAQWRENREENLAKDKARYWENHEENLARSRAYLEENREWVNLRRKALYHKRKAKTFPIGGEKRKHHQYKSSFWDRKARDIRRKQEQTLSP